MDASRFTPARDDLAVVAAAVSLETSLKRCSSGSSPGFGNDGRSSRVSDT